MGSMMLWSTPMLLSLAVLVTSLTVLLFSPYRRWVGSMLAGMVYFAVLKTASGTLVDVAGWSLIVSYAVSFLVSLLLLGIWLGRHQKATATADLLTTPVEHQPIRIQEIN